jgi:hypothetical protein
VSAATALRLRVTVFEVWQTHTIEASPDETVAQLKERSLALCSIPPGNAGAWEVKAGGAELRNESATLAAAGIPDGGALIVLRRRRRAVR